MRKFFVNHGWTVAAVSGLIVTILTLAASSVVWWQILLFVIGIVALAIVAAVAMEIWYREGSKVFNAVPYPRILALPTWLILRLLRRRLPDGHPWKARMPTLTSWAAQSTPLCRRFDAAFTYLLAVIGWFIYAMVRT